VGLAHWFSTGDEFSIGAIELATAAVYDDATDVVGVFLEGVSDSQHLAALASAIEATHKRVVAYRVSSSSAARAAAFGHTARIIGNDQIANAALLDAGINLTSSIEELCDVLTVLSTIGPRRRRGAAKIGIVTVSGGAGVIAADAVARSPSLELASFSGDENEVITKAIPAGTVATNPLDVPTLGAPSVFLDALDAVAATGSCDAVVAVVSTLAHDYDLLSNAKFPADVAAVLTHLSPEERFSREQSERLSRIGVAAVPNAGNAIAALAVWAGVNAGHHTYEPVPDAVRQLGLIGSRELLGRVLASRLARTEVARSADQAVAGAASLGVPVAIKADGAGTAHRTDLGAIALNLVSPDDVARAFDAISQRVADDAVVVQEMAPPGTELFVSAVRDPEVGVAGVLRPGGLLVELLGNTTIVTGDSSGWRDKLDRSDIGTLLNGYRGRPACDVDAVVRLLVDLVHTVRERSEILLVECNPVIVHAPGSGVTLVDVVTHVRVSK
jgi:acetyltransferase